MRNPSSRNRIPTELGERITDFLLSSEDNNKEEQAYIGLKISFYYKKDDKYICIDNTTQDCFIEEFTNEVEAMHWCKESDSIA